MDKHKARAGPDALRANAGSGLSLASAGAERARLFQGRGYFDLSMAQWELYDSIGMTPTELNENSGGHQPEIDIPEEWRGGSWSSIGKKWRSLRLLRAVIRR